MVRLKVTHDKYPEAAAAEAVKCLERANVDIDAQQLDEEIIIISADDPKRFDAAIEALKAAGFSVGHPDTSSGYDPQN